MRIALITLVILFAFFASNAQITVEVEIEKAEPLTQWNVERSGWTFPVFANPMTDVSDSEPQIIEGVKNASNLAFLMVLLSGRIANKQSRKNSRNK